MIRRSRDEPARLSLNDIHLALDGESPADDRADFEHWLDADHVDMKALQRARRARSRDAGGGACAGAAEPVPANARRSLPRRGKPRRSWTCAAALRCGARRHCGRRWRGGYSAVVNGSREPGGGRRSVRRDAIVAHTRPTLPTSRMSVEVGADQKHHPVGWLSSGSESNWSRRTSRPKASTSSAGGSRLLANGRRAQS